MYGIRDLQKKHMKETYVNEKGSAKETSKRDLQKRRTKETYKKTTKETYKIKGKSTYRRNK